ncbi:MAG: rod shape-determining protein MreD [Thalassovita sp.]
MSDAAGSRLWLMWLVFLCLSLGIIFFQLLPLETTPRRFTGPDLMVLFAFAWATRRPEYVPAFLIAGIMLLGDLLFQRPPGLMAALMVVATEAVKRRSRTLRDQGFPVEWLTITGTLVLVMLGYRLILALLIVPQAPMGLTLIQLIMSVISYPLVVLATQFVFGVRKVSPGETNAMGHLR